MKISPTSKWKRLALIRQMVVGGGMGRLVVGGIVFAPENFGCKMIFVCGYKIYASSVFGSKYSLEIDFSNVMLFRQFWTPRKSVEKCNRKCKANERTQSHERI